MASHDLLHPPGWSPALGYSNGVAANGRMIFVAGMIGWNAEQEFESDDFVEQAAQALRNIVAVLTWYITNRDEYLASQRGLGGAYREVIGKHFPAMTLVQVVALLEPRAKVEIEATAVVPL